MTDSEFIALADRTLARIGAALDDADAGADWSLVDGILTIETDDGGTIVVNRHLPNREIWVAAPSGAFHFKSDAGRWRDTRSGGELGAVMARILAEQAGAVLAPPDLPAA